MMVLIPLAVSLFVLFLSDNHFTLWIYQAFAAIFIIGMLSEMGSEFTRRTQGITIAMVAVLVLGGGYLFGMAAVFSAVALILGAGFVFGGLSAIHALINPEPGSGSVLTVMFVFAPIGLVAGCYYLAIGYQGLGLDQYLGLAQYLSILSASEPSLDKAGIIAPLPPI